MSRLHWRLLLLVAVALLISDLGRFAWLRNVAPTQVRIDEAGQIEYRAGLFARPLFAKLVLSSLHKRGRLTAGLYTVRGRHSDRTIVRYLANPRHREIVVVFPEGWRAAEMAVRLERAGVTTAAEFLAATTMREAYRPLLPTDLSLTEGTSLEGLLFPDTYRFHPDSPGEAAVKKLLLRFSEVIATTALTYDRLTLASIIEREARGEAERPIIAAVFLNRLSDGVQLEADPTVGYGRDTVQLTTQPSAAWRFWAAPEPAELQVDHPWNTYLRRGLPLTPISNPGLSSIEATLKPAPSKARYFFHDRTGNFVPSETLEEHNRKLRGG